jgi:hypothetical protein
MNNTLTVHNKNVKFLNKKLHEMLIMIMLIMIMPTKIKENFNIKVIREKEVAHQD